MHPAQFHYKIHNSNIQNAIISMEENGVLSDKIKEMTETMYISLVYKLV